MAHKSVTTPRSLQRISSYPLDVESYLTTAQLTNSEFNTFIELAEDMVASSETTYKGQLITTENGDVFLVNDSNAIVKIYTKDDLFDETKTYSAGDSIKDSEGKVMYAVEDLTPAAFVADKWSYNKIINVNSPMTLLEDFTAFCYPQPGGLTVTMPTSPTIGSKILLVDASGSALTDKISVVFTVEGYTGSVDANDLGTMLLDTNFATCELTFIGGAVGWMQTGGNVVTRELLEV